MKQIDKFFLLSAIYCLGFLLMGFKKTDIPGNKKEKPAIVDNDKKEWSSQFTDTTYRPDYTYNLNVYLFVPNDQQLDSVYHQRVSKYLLDGQAFYRTWMNHWGFGNRSFGLIKDTALQLVKLIIIRGAKPISDYPYSTTAADAMKAEINSYLAANPSDQTESKMNLVITYCKDHASANVPFFGYGTGWCFALDYPGMDLAAAAHQTTYVGGMMHELGHGLSLPHNGGIKSVNAQFGTSLMGTGNSTYGRSPTYLTKADCAILNDCQVFGNPVRNDWYAAVSDTLKNFNASYSNGNITVSGKFTSNSSVAVNYINYYNQKEETGGDYRSSVWATPVIGSDSFNVSMPYNDFSTSGDGNYKLRVMLVHENGKLFTRDFPYTVVGGIPQIDIHPGFFIKLNGLTDGVMIKKDSLLLSANAVDDNGIDNVQFFINGQQTASLTESPYEWSWKNIQPGRYTILAKAVNSTGKVTEDSATITLVGDNVTLTPPVADAYVQDGESASSNFGALEKMIVKKDNNVGFSRVSYLKFDLSNYTDSVNNAKLQLPIIGGGSGTVTTQWQLWYCNNDNWVESAITWNTKPAAASLIDAVPGKARGTAEWEISHALKAEMNSDKIITFAVVSTVAGQTADVIFNSRETVNELLRPQIIINAAPSITLAQPVKGDLFETGSSTTLKANLVYGASVTTVKFLVNGQEKISLNQAPYEWSWINMQPGIYGIMATATNDLGVTGFSDSITIRVKDTTGVINPIADSYVRDGSSNANSNFGTQQTLVVKKDANVGFSRISYLKFDLNDYKKVDTARLRLYILSGSINAAVTQWQLWKCDNDNWTETGITWNNKPVTSTLLGTIQGKRSAVAEWDISAAVNAEAGGDKILTLAIVSTVANGSSDVTFNSKEVANPTLRPQLFIEAPPVVTILTPVHGDSIIEQSTTLITTKVTDDKKIASVKFFINGEEKATGAQAPYEWNWTNNFPGEYGVRVKATDNSGLSTWSDSITVYVKDATAPVINCPADIVVGNDAGACGALVNFVTTATDNYSQFAISYSQNPGTQFPVGTTNVTAIATDEAGNSATCTFAVTVSDTEKPVLTCPTSRQFCYDASGNYTIPALTATDNCGINTTTYGISGATTRNGNGDNASGAFNPGVSTIVWTVTDIHGNSETCQVGVTINSELTASIADVYAVNPGGNANIIYLGYGPTSLTLNVVAEGGTAPYSYAWTNSSATSSSVVNPSVAGVHTYTVAITDGAGCTTIGNKNIEVVDIRSGINKVNICHNNNSLSINVGSVEDHIGHGDKLGGCDNTIVTAAKGKHQQESDTNQELFNVQVYPNPSASQFQLILQGNSKEEFVIKVTDMQGRLIKVISAMVGQTVQFGHDIHAGTYFVEAQQGVNRKTIKLVKL